MVISNRIRTAALMVTSQGTVSDIGCDHCLSLIYLIKNKLCAKGIGTDINIGPLKAAEKNVVGYGFHDKIELRLGYGLVPVKEGEADSIIIAGMGGRLINDIINNGLNVAKSASELILQPHLDSAAVRHNLHNSGFRIVDETLVFEEEKYYFTIKAVLGIERYNNEAEYLFGKALINRKDTVLNQYLKALHKKNLELLKKLEYKYTETTIKRLSEIEKLNKIIGEVLFCL